MECRVLGPLAVLRNGQVVGLGGYRQRLVLAVLLSRLEQPSSTESLIDAVWGAHPPRTARKTLQAYVTRLRHVLGEQVIETTPAGYVLRLTPHTLDSELFATLADQGRRGLDGDPKTALEKLDQALGQWRGRAYGELADEPALRGEVERLTLRRDQAREDRVAAGIACGRSAEIVDDVAYLATHHELNERVIGLHLQALYAVGRHADALAAYEQARARLADKLGVDPSPELVALHERILQRDPSLPMAEMNVEPQQSVRNPYKGLRVFEEGDAEDFFGREKLTATLVDAVAQRSFVAVVGASGSGKSSAVRAGLVPALRGREPTWAVVVMTPGGHPFDELRNAARRAGSEDVAWLGDTLDALRTLQALLTGDEHRVLLIVDQFEDLLTVDDDVRARFTANLLEVADDPQSQCGVLVTIRADHVDRALEAPGIGPRLAEGMVVALPLDSADVEAATVEPAAGVGVTVEPELVAVLAADMKAQPGALPLFQYALTAAFEHRRGTVVTRADYEAVGGLSGALAQRAEETFATLGAEERGAIRQVFLRLVAVDAGGETRRRITSGEVETLGYRESTVRTAINAFDRARLLTFDRSPDGEATVEVAHEALIREWPRLRGWLDEVRDDLRLQGILAAEVAEWEGAARDADYLITGSRLETYEAWPEAGSIRPSAAEEAFLDRSRLARDDRRQHDRTSRRRLRALAAVATAAAVVASGLAVVSARSSNEAQATAAAGQARQLADAAVAVRDADSDLGVLLGAEAVRTAQRSGRNVPTAYDALHQALEQHRLVTRLDDASATAFAADGLLVVAGERTRVLDPRSGEEVAVMETAEPLGSLSVSANGDRVLAGSTSGVLSLWNTRTGAHLEGFPADDTLPRDTGFPSVSLSPDGSRAVARGAYGVALTLWDTTSGARVGQRYFTDSDTFRVGVEFRIDAIEVADNGTLVYANRTGVQRGDGSGTWAEVVTSPATTITDVAFLGSQGRLVTTDDAGAVRLWGAQGEPLASLQAGSEPLTSVAIGQDGRIVALDTAGTVRLVNLVGNSLVSQTSFSGSDSALVAADLSGSLVTAVDDEGTGYVWDISETGGAELARWPGEGPVAVSPDGALLATGGTDALSIQVRDLVDDSPLTTLSPPTTDGATSGGQTDPIGAPAWLFDNLSTRVAGLEFGPGGALSATYQYAATGDWFDPRPILAAWDPYSATQGHTWVDWRPLFGPTATDEEGTLVAAAACAGGSAVWVFDVGGDEVELAGLLPHAQCGRSVDLEGAGQRLAVQVADTEASTGDLDEVQVWDLESLELISQAEHEPATTGSVRFSPDGTQVLSAGRDGAARIWDAGTGEAVQVLQADGGPMEVALWSPDGDTVVTSSHDGAVRVWDVATGAMTASISGHGQWPHIALTPDGRHLLTSADGSVRMWTLDTDELLELAEARASRSLTAGECDRYGITDCPTS